MLNSKAILIFIWIGIHLKNLSLENTSLNNQIEIATFYFYSATIDSGIDFIMRMQLFHHRSILIKYYYWFDFQPSVKSFYSFYSFFNTWMYIAILLLNNIFKATNIRTSTKYHFIKPYFEHADVKIPLHRRAHSCGCSMDFHYESTYMTYYYMYTVSEIGLMSK